MFSHQIVFDPALIARYDRSGPRYTSYPTAVQFRGAGSTGAAGAGDARDGGGRATPGAVAGMRESGHAGFGEAQYRAQAARTNAETPGRPLSLYFHLPFCDTVCYYCACNKIVTRNRKRAAPYLTRLHKEIALQGALFDKSRRVDQLHWGGGTPTFLSHDEMRELMRVTRAHFSLRDDDRGEYGIEVDPREVEPGGARAFARAWF